MEQLPLEIFAPATPDFANFIPGRNAEAVQRVRELAEGRLAEPIIYVWGERGCGKTHLLSAAARLNPALVLADDVAALDATAQQALFVAINAARDGAVKVLAAGSDAPAGLALREDLRTRLAWGLVYHLSPLSDEEKKTYLISEGRRRGMALSEDIVAYLLSRLPRDFASLAAVLDALDRHALARQRPLTLPLVRDALYGRKDAKKQH
ncbi:MAG TPA: DnaA/Hda family protein [Burkholderiales bacterium]|jgi:DnaA family protein|nr:DnaA/Hda family protein [Burkholderiales bacterium]